MSNNNKATLTHLQFYRKLYYKYISYVFTIYGRNFLEVDNVMTPRAYGVIVIVIAFVSANLYTMVSNYKDPDIFVQCTILLILSSLGFIKALTYLGNLSKLRDLVQYIENIYVANTKSCDENINVLSKVNNIMRIVLGMAVIGYLLTFICFLLMPFYIYIQYDEVTKLMPTLLPGLTGETLLGFILLNLFHLSIMVIGVGGASAIDLVYLAIILSTMILAGLFGTEFRRLNLALGDKVNENEVKHKFKNILLMHQEITRYMKKVDSTYWPMSAGSVAASSLSLVVIIYVILKMNWVHSYFIALIHVTQLFLTCLMGTIIEMINDHIYSSITNGKYYLLPIREQKIYLFLLMKAQRPNALTVGGIVPLNMETFVSVMKTVYSVAMMLTNFD